jgi:tRNA dimethylallyltransferase
LNIDSKNNERLPVVIIVGPTAVGKSSLIYDIFSNEWEIINGDSQQVYRSLSIGTAKPKEWQFRLLRHHLYDFIDPKQQFNAGEFVKKADTCIASIHGRGKLPVIVGGTGFYIKNFIYGLPEAPSSQPDIRQKLKKEILTRGLPCLYDRLKKVDPLYAEKIKKNDLLRIIRALEVYEVSGRPLSSFDVPLKKRKNIIPHVIGLTIERKQLYRRINDRVEKMFIDGLIDEIKFLMRMGYNEYDPGMKGIGYREFFLMQKGCFTFRDIAERIKQNSRRYAKRQITFFKSLPDVIWFHPDEKEKIVMGIRAFLEKSLSRDFSFEKIFKIV